MAVEVIAVRYACDWGCEATVICRDGDLPPGWFEMPAPPWRSHHRPRHVCPDHALAARGIHRAQWAAQRGRTHVVSVEQYEATKVALRHASHLLERLQFDAQRAGDG